MPDHDCPLCPRLRDFRLANRQQYPDFFNGPVPPFGVAKPKLLITGLAPGVKGANRTGRPFTGDFAGELLYSTIAKFGFSKGEFQARPDDGLTLVDCRISNAVKCVPPQNKPLPVEINTCSKTFLQREIEALPSLRIILALGQVAHQAVLGCLGEKRSRFPFGHGARHPLSNGLVLYDSYHCSRYNTNTRVLTVDMFHAVFAAVRREIDKAA